MRLPDGRVRKFRKSSNKPGQAHELTFSCYRRMPLLSRDRTRGWLIDALDESRRALEFDLWAYVVMPEHVHLLVFPRGDRYDVAAILKRIKQPVAQRAIAHLKRNAPKWLDRLRVPRRDGRMQHRFWEQGGGYDRDIVSPTTAWTCVAYIHANPVRRGLAASQADWDWSSARWYAGLDNVKLEMDGPPPDPPPAAGGTGQRS